MMKNVFSYLVSAIALFIFSPNTVYSAGEDAELATVEQLAAQLEATINALGPHVVLYSVNRPHCEGDDCEPGYSGYKTLIVDGESGVPGAPWFREQIHQFDEEHLLIERQMWVFDGESTRGYQPNNHSGSFQQGEKFRPGDDARKLYRERMAQELTAMLRGEVGFIEVVEYNQLDETRYQAVLQTTQGTGGARFIIDFDAERGALPARILRQNGTPSEDGSDLIWEDFTDARILEWLEVSDGLYFPKTSVLDYLSQNIPSISMEILAFEQWDAAEIAAIAQAFEFPDGAAIHDALTQERHVVESDVSRHDIQSFFTLAFGITWEESLERFDAIRAAQASSRGWSGYNGE